MRLEPTAKQLEFVRALAAESVLDEITSRAMERLETFDRQDVSALIEVLKGAPKKLESIRAGMFYTQDQDVVRVYPARAGHLLAARLVMLEDESGFTYEYLGSLQTLVRGRTKLGVVQLKSMSMLEATNWGKATGSCIVCGRALTDPSSVAAGIGPICAKNF